jgi:flagellar protein FlaJ
LANQTKREEAQLTDLERFTSVSYGVFGSQARRLARSFPNLKDHLLKSDLNITPEGLVSVALMATYLALLAAVLVAVLGVFVLSVDAFALVLVAPVLVFFVTVYSPRFSQANRSSALEHELPFLVGFMAILSGGGEGLVDVLRKISGMEIFPASAKEAERILADVDIYGIEPVVALEKASRYNPNRWFSDLLAGYATVIKTGGDHVNYLNGKLKEVFEERATRVKRSAESIGSLAEVYLIVTVVLGLTVFTLYLVQTFLVSGSGGITNIEFFAFLVVPIVSAGMVWMVDSIQPKWPFIDYTPYVVFAGSIPFGLAVYMLPIPTYLFLHVALALLVTSLPGAVVATRLSQERRGVERMLPDFIRDVAEGRKIGLSPEAAIERLIGVDYGLLSSPVHAMAAQLTWGISLKHVVTSFTDRVQSWISKASGTLLLEVVEVGGGTVRGFSEMADFTRRVSLSESETRSALRTYTLIAYISGIMIVGTTFIFVYFLSQGQSLGVTGSLPGLKITGSTVDLLLTAAVFEGWVIGLVAGKMGEGSLAEGFKHSIILVAITVLTVAVAGTFFPIPL